MRLKKEKIDTVTGERQTEQAQEFGRKLRYGTLTRMRSSRVGRAYSLVRP